MRTIHALLGVVLLIGWARADVLHVPADFIEVQGAVDAAADGDEIVIAPGTYEGVILIQDKLNLRLRGQGSVHLVGSVAGEPNVLINSSSGIVLEHLRVEHSEGDGIAITGSDDVTLTRCRVAASQSHGVHVGSCNHLTLDRVVVTDSNLDGVNAIDTDFITLSRCTIAGASEGVLIDQGTGHILERVKVSGVSDAGLALGATDPAGVSSSVLRKCVVRDCGAMGFALKGSALLVEDNQAIDPGTHGLQVFGGSCILRDNLSLRAPQDGLLITAGAHQVLDNRLISSGEDGLRVTGSPATVLSGNRVSKTAGDGILVAFGSDDVVVVGNTITSSLNSGIVLASDGAEVSGNSVQGSGQDGLHVSGSGGIFTGNKAKGSALFDLFDFSANGNTYVDNVFGTTQLP
jgi:hypothetical protein